MHSSLPMPEAPGTPAGADTPGVIAPPPLIYLGGLAVGFALEAALAGPSLPRTVTVPLGAALAAGGGALARSFFTALSRAGTPVSPYRAPSILVTSGPYRHTRNPGYLGMALAYAGIALLADAPWALAPLPVVLAVVDRGVISREERWLQRRFGEQYSRYRRRTRRWI